MNNKMKKINKILIANRGEIAVRIIRTANDIGIKTVAVYSEIDKKALHVKMANEAFCIGKQELSETYLNIKKIIEVAKSVQCDAIHPGYGFLSENPKFVDACEEAGIIFIGPGKKPIQLMGNKIEARKFVKELGIPMTEGITGSPDQLLKNAYKIPLPILVKAAAGGGGKGMRIVRKSDELKQVLETTSREAKNYFGDPSIYIEQYIEEPRHIEFQVMGDNYGNVVHLFERECTIQRRYQKIIEESPSPTLTPEIRKKMGEAAVAITKKVGYNSAGTIEFLVDKNLNFYFLEMNTRIQVEHPVTEMITGVDLIEEQIWVAAGNKLRLKQDQLSQNGHAIECRIYAEDPENNFMPSPGIMTFYQQPAGKDIRVDSGIEHATTIFSFFDPMISKMVVWGENREVAIRTSVNALHEYIIQGIQTNIEFLSQVLQHKAFKKNQISTRFCDEHSADLLEAIHAAKSRMGSIPQIAATVYALNASQLNTHKNIWEKIGYWRNLIHFSFTGSEKASCVEVNSMCKNKYQLHIDDKKCDIELIEITKNFVSFFMGKKKYDAFISTDTKGIYFISIQGNSFKLQRNDVLDNTETASTGAQGESGNNLFAPMPGKVLVINVKEGQKVKRGTVLLVVEAMKMENNIVAGVDAIIEKVNVVEGEMVDTEKQLVQFKNIKN
jgi:acetyl-CoA carboxylase biotin carboxylase subunit